MQLSKFSYRKSFIVLICCLSILASCSKIKKDPKVTTAIVNGKAITRATFDAEMDRVKQKFQGMNSDNPAEMKGIQSEILEILVGGELLYQASIAKGIEVSSSEVNEELERVQNMFKQKGTKSAPFTKEDIKRKMAIEEFINKEFSEPTVISDAESNKYYNDNLDDFTKPEQVMTSHILIRISPDAAPDKLASAKNSLVEVKKKITAGADFAEMAKHYSQDSTAKSGGALGYIMRSQIVEPFEKAAFSLSKNEVSDIVQTKYGFHLIKVLDKKPMIITSYDEVADKLKAYLKQQKVQKLVDSFIKAQRQKAEVEIFLPKS